MPPLPANAPRPEKPADPADFVVVTGFTEVDGATRVWIEDRVKSKRSVLLTGDSFAVGNVKGTVQAFRAKGDVVIEFEGHRRLLHSGDNLHGGVEIPNSQPNEHKESANSTDPAPDRDIFLSNAPNLKSSIFNSLEDGGKENELI